MLHFLSTELEGVGNLSYNYNFIRKLSTWRKSYDTIRRVACPSTKVLRHIVKVVVTLEVMRYCKESHAIQKGSHKSCT